MAFIVAINGIPLAFAHAGIAPAGARTAALAARSKNEQPPTNLTRLNPKTNTLKRSQPKNHPASASELSRRQFLGSTARGLGLAALCGALPRGWIGGLYASDAPEISELKFGIIALTDCSSIVIAHEKGLFKKYGINSTVAKGASWAAIRDSLSNGDIQATHMLTGMPIAATMGLLGSPKKPMIIPWMINRNGQSITLKKELKGAVKDDPKALKPLVDEAKAKGTPMTFAMTFPPGTHAMWIRYYLGAGGINPDKDVALITIPPAQMVANMKIGKMDGFCVGEPWNARAIADGIVSQPTYINCPREIIIGRLLGDYDFGDGRKKQDANYMIFHKRNCNYPQPKYAMWWLTQFRRWAMVDSAPDYTGVAKQVMRPDIYEEAMKEIGYAHGGQNNEPETLFDGATFDPVTPEEYAKSFPVNNLKG